jgi:hypothetical protein
MAGHHGSERLGEQGRGLGVTELDKGCSHREMNQSPFPISIGCTKG